MMGAMTSPSNASSRIFVPPMISGVSSGVANFPTANRNTMSYGMASNLSPASMYGMSSYGSPMAGTAYPNRLHQGHDRNEVQDKETRSLARILTAAGIANEDGRVNWPLGLQILPAPGSDERRQQIEALLAIAALQAMHGQADSRVLDQITNTTQELRQLLKKDHRDRFSMPEKCYEEAEQFLGQLLKSTRILSLRLGYDEGSSPSVAKLHEGLPSSINEVAVEIDDDRFEPAVITISVGAAVQWTNHGRHSHTVTSDQETWDSGELAHQGIYVHTFTQKGRFAYYCRMHPRQMRGEVIVE
jgi:plastocyanin